MLHVNSKVRWNLVLLTALSPLVVSLMLASPSTDQGTQPETLFHPLIPPGNCQSCHGNFDFANNIEPHATWSGSMMAQAGRDPIFWAALDVANNDVPGIGDFCLRCHTPIGWLAGRSEEPGGSPDGCSLQGTIDTFGQDFDGVTCHLCHRMYENPSPPLGEDSLYFENGQYWIDDAPCPDGPGLEPCRRGPYDYPDPDPEPRHNWAYSDYHVNGNLCGTCHNVTNPLHNLIEDGVDTGVGFPIERTFLEWQQSDYSDEIDLSYKTCQNCHMPDASVPGPDEANACFLNFPDREGNMPIHRFAGGNAWIPDVIRQEYPNLFIDDNLIATRDWALDMLQNQSADVEITVPADVDGGSDLNVDVKVTNLSGHKLPTGYAEGRRMWINVRVLDGDSNLIWESGAYDDLTGILTQDAQVKIYHAEQGIWNVIDETCDIEDGLGTPVFHFALNNCIAVDNRIPPLGFTGGSHIETQPKNYVYPEASPGVLVNYDTTSYTIPIPEGTPSPLVVTALLKYQTTSKEYVEFLQQEAVVNGFPADCIERLSGFPTESRGQLLMNMWNTYGKAAPVQMDGDTGFATVNLILGAAGDLIATGYYAGSGGVDITYTAATAATDHSIYIGDLDNVGTLILTDQSCGIGTSGAATFVAGTGSKFFLVVGNDGENEGSYGTDGYGAERVVDRTQPPCVGQ